MADAPSTVPSAVSSVGVTAGVTLSTAQVATAIIDAGALCHVQVSSSLALTLAAGLIVGAHALYNRFAK